MTAQAATAGGFGLAGLSAALGTGVGSGSGSASAATSGPVTTVVNQLASTGASHLTEYIAAGVVLLVSGVALLGLGRRRRDDEFDSGEWGSDDGLAGPAPALG